MGGILVLIIAKVLFCRAKKNKINFDYAMLHMLSDFCLFFSVCEK